MLTLVDNYDSFLHNLARYIRRLGVEVVILRNDDIGLRETIARSSAVLFSPGPCSPNEAGQCLDLIRAFSGQVPILGVCLGHQAICQAFGASIVRARQPMHGMVSEIAFSDSPLFAGLSSPSEFARYHSLICDESSIPDCLKVTARTHTVSAGTGTSAEVGEIMAVEHAEHPTFGVQFHPESVLSRSGYQILANFLSIAGLQHAPLPANDTDSGEQLMRAESGPNTSLQPAGDENYYSSFDTDSQWLDYPRPGSAQEGD